jgi:Tfp pilus assembly protein PilV
MKDLPSQGARTKAGFTIVEAAIASVVVALFLGSMFALNSACLSLVRNSKESAEAMLSNQERVEQLRSCNWSQITDSAYWTDTINNPSYYLTSILNAATQTGADLANATEIVRVTENNFLQGASAAYFEITRTPTGASITAQNNPSTLVTARMLKVNLTLNWNTLGGRARSRASTSVIARGGLTINETTTIAPTVTW